MMPIGHKYGIWNDFFFQRLKAGLQVSFHLTYAKIYRLYSKIDEYGAATFAQQGSHSLT